MFDLDKWEEIWITIARHRLRTALTAFGVFWGIFMLVILLGAGRGLENGALQNFDYVKNGIALWTRETSVAYEGLEAGRRVPLDNQDARALRQLPQLAHIAPRLGIGTGFDAGSLTIERGDESLAFRVMGDTPAWLEIKPLVIEAGRFVNELDIEDKRKVAVISTLVRDQLFDADEAVIGEYIRIGGVSFRVVGIFNTRVQGQAAMDDLQALHIPISTAQQTFNMPNLVHWFGLVPAAGVPAVDAEEAAKRLLRKRHRISPEDRQAIDSFNAEEAFRDMRNVFDSIAGFSWFVAIGSIIAGMVGVANIMLIIVKERTNEIGIRKSVGAKPASIVLMIVLEASVISGVAGYLGLLTGVALIEAIDAAMVAMGIQSQFFFNPEIDFQVASTAVAVLLVSGVVAGLFPGVKAARVQPALALRD